MPSRPNAMMTIEIRTSSIVKTVMVFLRMIMAVTEIGHVARVAMGPTVVLIE